VTRKTYAYQDSLLWRRKTKTMKMIRVECIIIFVSGRSSTVS
jgi:hypothetical protein